MASPFSLVEILRESLRSITFTLPLAAAWVTGAVLFAPQATTEELVLTVAVPILLVTIGSRLQSIRRPDQRPTAEGVKRLLKVAHEHRLVRLIVLSILFIVLGFSTLISIPIYVLLGISWAPLFGLISSVLLVVFGVGLFVVSLTGFALLKPRVLLAIFQVLRHQRRRRGGDDWRASAMRAFLG